VFPAEELAYGRKKERNTCSEPNNLEADCHPSSRTISKHNRKETK